MVLNVDVENERLSLGIKQLKPDPWTELLAKHPIGSTVEGKVTRVADFGAFVELEPGLEGLIHVSELSTQRVRAASEVVKVGQEVQAAVLDVDKANRRMSLSLKRVAEIVPVGSAFSPSAQPAGPKKKRPELRGGLDFEERRNK